MGHISFGHRRQVLLAATLVAAALSVTACGGNKNVRGDAPGMPQAGMNGQGQGQGQGMGSGRDSMYEAWRGFRPKIVTCSPIRTTRCQRARSISIWTAVRFRRVFPRRSRRTASIWPTTRT